MKVEVDLPDELVAFISGPDWPYDDCGPTAEERLLYMLDYIKRCYSRMIEHQRHEKLLKLLGVEHIIDAGDWGDGDIPF